MELLASPGTLVIPIAAFAVVTVTVAVVSVLCIGRKSSSDKNAAVHPSGKVVKSGGSNDKHKAAAALDAGSDDEVDLGELPVQETLATALKYPQPATDAAAARNGESSDDDSDTSDDEDSSDEEGTGADGASGTGLVRKRSMARVTPAARTSGAKAAARAAAPAAAPSTQEAEVEALPVERPTVTEQAPQAARSASDIAAAVAAAVPVPPAGLQLVSLRTGATHLRGGSTSKFTPDPRPMFAVKPPEELMWMRALGPHGVNFASRLRTHGIPFDATDFLRTHAPRAEIPEVRHYSRSGRRRGSRNSSAAPHEELPSSSRHAPRTGSRLTRPSSLGDSKMRRAASGHTMASTRLGGDSVLRRQRRASTGSSAYGAVGTRMPMGDAPPPGLPPPTLGTMQLGGFGRARRM